MENVSEHNVVNVLSQEVEQEPVTNSSLVHHHLHTVRLDPAVAQLEEISSERGRETQGDSEMKLPLGNYYDLPGCLSWTKL